MLIIVEKDSAQSNDSAQNGIRKYLVTPSWDRSFDIHVHIMFYIDFPSFLSSDDPQKNAFELGFRNDL